MGSEDQERASWDSAKDAFLVEIMMHGFKKEAWAETLAAFNARFQTMLSRQQIKSRLTALKGINTAIKAMLDASDFGWDDERHIVLVHDSVWNDYVRSYAKVVDYRRKAMLLFDDLRDFFREHALRESMH
ncbi:Myb/SANT-like DNA-binding domain [Phytophthora infestans]|uniref:Myb/SANT-like DNA-binding domain n=1 Tax=Phytophthora infestans TaxID=4787 RepID=A0A8S9V4R4_PHYIN|nr:Myb/SANT-like DNA-binding domain [Phytophthora infestans]